MKFLSIEISGFLWAILACIQIIAWIWAIIDIVNSKFRSNGEQLVWILVVFLMPFLGTLIYFLTRNKRNQ
jgi:uncharacterized RDD family membrane protein YckC